MKEDADFLTIKQAARQTNKSEQTIRRLVKQHAQTSHIRVESTPKGDLYLISQTLLVDQYPPAKTSVAASPMETTATKQEVEVASLQQVVAERDHTIQQLQHRLLAQNDVLQALTNHLTSQRIERIEELLLTQSEQLGELQKRLSEPLTLPLASSVLATPPRKTLWQRLLGK